MSKNKPRHKFKQDGTKTSYYCSCCGYYNCDPMFAPFPPTRAELKKEFRFQNKLCQGCGQKICKCKNKKGY